MTEASPNTISETQARIVQSLKRLDASLPAREIPVYNDNRDKIGWLSPITPEKAEQPEIIKSLLAWRMKYMNAFLTQFNGSIHRTKDWLERVVIPSHSRILFLILSEKRQPIGNIGVCNIAGESAELDNVIRGEKSSNKTLIFFSVICLMRWVYDVLSCQTMYVRVFSNNDAAVSLYSSAGFAVERSYPLRRVEENEEVRFEVCSEVDSTSPNFTLLKIIINKDEFFLKHPWVRSVPVIEAVANG